MVGYGDRSEVHSQGHPVVKIHESYPYHPVGHGLQRLTRRSRRSWPSPSGGWLNATSESRRDDACLVGDDHGLDPVAELKLVEDMWLMWVLDVACPAGARSLGLPGAATSDRVGAGAQPCANGRIEVGSVG